MGRLDTKSQLNILFVAALLLLWLSALLAQNTTCNLYNDNGGPVNITKTQTTPQKVVEGRARKLYCHADNFCQIDWFRDGIPRDGFKYLWNFSSDFQQNWMSLEDDNQTLNFHDTTCDAEAGWMCVVTGERHAVNHTMDIIVTGPPYEGHPIFHLDDDCFNKSAKFGEKVKLICPCTAEDVTPEIKIEWFKWVESAANDDGDDNTNDDDGDDSDRHGNDEVDTADGGQWVHILDLGENGTQYTLTPPQIDIDPHCPHTTKLPTIRQDLIINELSEKELGIYRLVATRNDNSEYKGLNNTHVIYITKYVPPIPIGDNSIAIGVGAAVAGITLLAVVTSILWHQKGVDVKLWMKDRYGKIESGDGKKYDAYISYSESDTDLKFVLDTLKPALQEAGYVLYIKDIDAIPGGTLVEQLISSLESSRRCILVISADFIRARHAALQVEVATDQMLRHQSKIIPVIFQSVKRETIKKLRGLDRLLVVLRALRWDDSKEAKKNEKVLKQLLYRMPPVHRGERSHADLPLSSRLPHGEQSCHSSQQSLVPNEGASTPTSIHATLPTVPINNTDNFICNPIPNQDNSQLNLDYNPNAVKV